MRKIVIASDFFKFMAIAMLVSVSDFQRGFLILLELYRILMIRLIMLEFFMMLTLGTMGDLITVLALYLMAHE